MATPWQLPTRQRSPVPRDVAAASRARSGVCSSCRSGSAAAATSSASGCAGSGSRRRATGSVPGPRKAGWSWRVKKKGGNQRKSWETKKENPMSTSLLFEVFNWSTLIFTLTYGIWKLMTVVLVTISAWNHCEVQSGATMEGIACHSSMKALLVVSDTFMASGGKVEPLTCGLCGSKARACDFLTPKPSDGRWLTFKYPSNSAWRLWDACGSFAGKTLRTWARQNLRSQLLNPPCSAPRSIKNLGRAAASTFKFPARKSLQKHSSRTATKAWSQRFKIPETMELADK